MLIITCITIIIKKCNAILISLYQFRHHFNQETLKLLIETHVFPQILYCISVWGGAAKNQLFRIQKVINFGARIVLGVRRRDRIGPALASLGWARIEQLVREKDLIKIYKALHYQLYPLSIRRMAYVYPSIYGVSSYYPFNRSRGLGASKMLTLIHSERVPLPSLCLMESAASGHYRAAYDLFLPYVSEAYGHECIILSG